MYKMLSDLAEFCRQCDKNILVFFSRFTISTAVHLQNPNTILVLLYYCRDTIQAR